MRRKESSHCEKWKGSGEGEELIISTYAEKHKSVFSVTEGVSGGLGENK